MDHTRLLFLRRRCCLLPGAAAAAAAAAGASGSGGRLHTGSLVVAAPNPLCLGFPPALCWDWIAAAWWGLQAHPLRRDAAPPFSGERGEKEP